MMEQAEDLTAVVDAPMHPLEPATGAELSAAVAILRASGRLGAKAFFSAGYAAEPPKALILGFTPGDSWDRVIRLVGHDRERCQSFDAQVSLTSGEVAAFTWVEDGQAPVGADDYLALLKTLFRNEEWLAALKQRGIEDPSLVHVEPWVAGAAHPDLPHKARAIRAIAFLHAHPGRQPIRPPARRAHRPCRCGFWPSDY